MCFQGILALMVFLGPLPRHVNLIFCFIYEEKGMEAFCGRGLAVNSGWWEPLELKMVYKGGCPLPSWSLLLTCPINTANHWQALDRHWGKCSPACGPQTFNASITWISLEMQVPGLHPKSAESETLEVGSGKSVAIIPPRGDSWHMKVGEPQT